ncbi:MAG: hypothetical protein NZM31_10150 [Gemmatales bacterium]|nr:hypothetical protein [Gemmatales bacterium]MDW8387357.1 hypothetical protein [Gemmatales bacterium]
MPITYLTEAKPQCYRALAVFDDRSERLIYLGRSSSQVRQGYVQAFFEVLDEEEQARVVAVHLQRWHGAPDAGRWVMQSPLTLPTAKVAAKSA